MPIKTYPEILAEAKSRILETTPRDAIALQGGDTGVVFLDVREPNEWNLGHLPGAIHIPRGNLESRIENAVPRDRTVVIYCASGNRSAFAADVLQQMGYTKVSSLFRGIRGWVEEGGDVEG